MEWVIKSRAFPSRTLAVVARGSEAKHGRTDLCEPEHAMQAACIHEDQGRKYGAHYHLLADRGKQKATEAWVVIRGRVAVSIHDVNDEWINGFQLAAGDMVVCLAGGHGYEILEDDTLVYEIKLGPYFGAEKDKEYIE